MTDGKPYRTHFEVGVGCGARPACWRPSRGSIPYHWPRTPDPELVDCKRCQSTYAHNQAMRDSKP